MTKFISEMQPRPKTYQIILKTLKTALVNKKAFISDVKSEWGSEMKRKSMVTTLRSSPKSRFLLKQ